MAIPVGHMVPALMLGVVLLHAGCSRPKSTDMREFVLLEPVNGDYRSGERAYISKSFTPMTDYCLLIVPGQKTLLAVECELSVNGQRVYEMRTFDFGPVTGPIVIPIQLKRPAVSAISLEQVVDQLKHSVPYPIELSHWKSSGK